MSCMTIFLKCFVVHFRFSLLICVAFFSLSEQKQYICDYGRHWNNQFTCKVDSYHFNQDTKDVKFSGTIENKSNTTRVLIEKSKIHYVSSVLFDEFPNLDGIKIEMSGMSRITEQTLSDLAPLIYLDLENNKIKELHEETFDNLHKLEFLSLAGNEIEKLPNGIFLYNKNIRELDLADNKLKQIDKHLFNHLINLEYLSLWKNELFTLPQKTFENNLRLKTISLADNNIYMLHPRLFENLQELHYLNLLDNVCVKKVFKTSSAISTYHNEMKECHRRCKENRKCWQSDEY